jgi:hypothetical protein
MVNTTNKHSCALDSQVIKAYQLLAHGRWFFPGTPASSIAKTGRYDIAEILLKVTLRTYTLFRSLYLIQEIFKFYENKTK